MCRWPNHFLAFLLQFHENQSMKSELVDYDLLAMALVGYQAQKAKLDAAIAGIQAQLIRRAPSSGSDPLIPRKRTMSAAGRRRIAAAQRKRWAATKKTNAEPAPKRKLSAAGRKAIADAARKRWAALRKAKERTAATA